MKNLEALETIDKTGKDTLVQFKEAVNYNKWIIEQFSDYLQGEDLLEIGCGLGNITSHFADKFRVTAVDIQQNYLDYVKNKFKIKTFKYDLSKKPYFNREFDSVYSLNVLEHIKNQEKALKNIHKALKDNGRLVILVPAFNWLFGSLDKEIYHYRRYTKKSLRRVLEKTGFSVSRTMYFNVFGIPGWFLNGRILKKKDIPDGQLKLFNKLVPLLKILDKPFHPFMGISVIAFAEKI